MAKGYRPTPELSQLAKDTPTDMRLIDEAGMRTLAAHVIKQAVSDLGLARYKDSARAFLRGGEDLDFWLALLGQNTEWVADEAKKAVKEADNRAR